MPPRTTYRWFHAPESPENTIATSLRPGSLRAWILAAVLICATTISGCADDEPDAPILAMPDLVGKPMSAALAETYDELHTSLVAFDLSPADRRSDEKWVVVATSPEAGEKTPKFTRVYAWVLKASEYAWFQENPTMPAIPDEASSAKLVAQGGLLAPVKDLVQFRWDPEAAPKSALPSPVDKAAFTPDRGMRPDLAAEPLAEFETRTGLFAAPVKGTVAVDSRPAADYDLRMGQYLVVLVKKTPAAKPRPPAPAPAAPAPSTNSSGSTGGSSGGSSSTGPRGFPNGFPTAFPTRIPNCPKRICG